jgi:lipopolysaccharide transport system ATP-binding protein
MSTVIRVQNLSKKYILRHQVGGRSRYVSLRDVLTNKVASIFKRQAGMNAKREDFWALNDVSFEIKQGEAVGIIGRNGSGKSTLLKILSRITKPSQGRIEINGLASSLLEVGTGFHPELSGRENIYLNGAILGMSRSEIKKRFDAIVAFAEVEKFLDTPVKHFSSGMYMRLAFAVAAHLESTILIIDEVLAVGDAEFQKKCLGKMQSVSETEGRTVLFVSHNMQAVRQMCPRVILLQKGKVLHNGDTYAGINAYLGQGIETSAHQTVELFDYPRSYATEGATFLRVRFTKDQGQPASTVSPTDILGVEVDISVKKILRNFNLAMAVVHADGLRIFSESYSDEHDLPDLKPGDYTVCFQIPMRFFKMESYFLTLAMNENGTHCDHVDGLLMPEIVDENPNLQMESQRWGVLRVPVSWDVIRPISSEIKQGMP